MVHVISNVDTSRYGLRGIHSQLKNGFAILDPADSSRKLRLSEYS